MNPVGQIPRSTVLNLEPLKFKTKPNAFSVPHHTTRVWLDSVEIFGTKFEKKFYALEGGQDPNENKQGQAAAGAIVTNFYLGGPNGSAEVGFTLGLAFDTKQWEEFEVAANKIATATPSLEERTIKFGAANQKQELKYNQSKQMNEWGIMCDVSELCFVPKNPHDEIYHVSTMPMEIGGATAEGILYKQITFINMKLDAAQTGKDNIPVCHGDPSAKGSYPILSIEK